MQTRPLFSQILQPRCPRCGEGPLFKNTLDVADACSACGLVMKHHDAADGPAFFAITLVGFIIMGAAALVEIKYAPPLWLHAALWLPLTVILCLVFLRVFKAAILTVEYRLALLKEGAPHE